MRSLCVVLAFSVLMACGGSPTSPESVSSQSTTAVVSPTPAPAPEPGPAPPAGPTPDGPTNPAPPPGAPATVVTYQATVTSAHWYGAAVLPDQFDVQISDGRITFGPLTADVLIQDARSVFARPNGANLQLLFDGDGGSWTYNGEAGQAMGTLVK
jgi:hypothetical protein